MIRSTIILVLLSLGINGFCSTPIDSLKAKINQIEKVDQKRIDSLQRELQFYKVKEDYYSSAVDRQASHFEALLGILISIIGIGIGLLSFISFRFIDKKIETARSNWNQSIEAQDVKNEEFLTETNNIKADLYYQIGVSISRHTFNASAQMETFQNLNGYLAALNNLMQAYIYESDSEKKTMLEQTLLRNLRINTNLLNQLIDEIGETEGEEKVDMCIKAKQSIDSGKRLFFKFYPTIYFADFQSQAVELIALLNRVANL